MVLQAKDAIGHRGGDKAENQHRDAILLPVLLAFGIDAQHAVNEPFQPAQCAGPETYRPRLFRIENLKQINPQRLGDRHQEEDVNRELNPAGRRS